MSSSQIRYGSRITRQSLLFHANNASCGRSTQFRCGCRRRFLRVTRLPHCSRAAAGYVSPQTPFMIRPDAICFTLSSFSVGNAADACVSVARDAVSMARRSRSGGGRIFEPREIRSAPLRHRQQPHMRSPSAERRHCSCQIQTTRNSSVG